MQLLQKESMSKPDKAAPVPGPLDAPAAPSATVPVKALPKSASIPTSASKPPQAAPVEVEKSFKEPLVEGMEGKEEYGYIVTNQRSAFVLIAMCSYYLWSFVEKNGEQLMR